MAMNMWIVVPIVAIAVAAGAAAAAWQATQAPAKPVVTDAKPEGQAQAEKPDPYVLNHTMKLIDGTTDKSLKDFEGKVVLIVNVASKCGYTRQYSGLEKLYKEYKDKGLVVLGFPANEFGGQEPGTNAEIQQFCTSKYSVTFPMFAKTVVTGEGTSALFTQLAALDGGKPPSWNFNKYLIGKDGRYIAHYESRVKPDDEVFVKAIKEALGLVEVKAAVPAVKPAATSPAAK